MLFFKKNSNYLNYFEETDGEEVVILISKFNELKKRITRLARALTRSKIIDQDKYHVLINEAFSSINYNFSGQTDHRFSEMNLTLAISIGDTNQIKGNSKIFEKILINALNDKFWKILIKEHRINELFDDRSKDILNSIFQNKENIFPDFDEIAINKLNEELSSYINGAKLLDFIRSSQNNLQFDKFPNEKRIEIKIPIEKVNGFFDETFFGFDRFVFFSIVLFAIYTEDHNNWQKNPNLVLNKMELNLDGVSFKKKINIDYGEYLLCDIRNEEIYNFLKYEIKKPD